MDEWLKLDVTSLSEVPADCGAEALWLTTYSDTGWLDGGELPPLPALKVLCIPDGFLIRPWNMPALPELTCLWVGAHTHVDEQGALVDCEWMRSRFPKLRLFISEGRYIRWDHEYPIPCETRRTLIPGVWTQLSENFTSAKAPMVALPDEHMLALPGVADARKTPFEKLSSEPRAISVYMSDCPPLCWITGKTFIDFLGSPASTSDSPRLRLLYNADSLYLAYPVWRIESLRHDILRRDHRFSGIWVDKDGNLRGAWREILGNCQFTGAWAGIEVHFRFIDYWMTNGTFLLDGILQFDWRAMLKRPPTLYHMETDASHN